MANVGKTVMVTGAGGYIGSHTCVELLEAGYEVVAVDNLCNSSRKSLERVQQITGKKLVFHEADTRDADAMEKIFGRSAVDAIIHFAGLKAVGESAAKPLMYYDNNVAGTVALLQVAKKAGVRHFVFSSSATVYGDPDYSPVPETGEIVCRQPVWSFETDDRGNPERSVVLRCFMGGCHIALFQSCRRTSQRTDR